MNLPARRHIAENRAVDLPSRKAYAAHRAQPDFMALSA
jgi:hypothetical protein